MEAKDDTNAKDESEIVGRLSSFPNPNAIWSAFRAGMIEEETARKLVLMTKEHLTVPQRIINAIFDSVTLRLGD